MFAKVWTASKSPISNVKPSSFHVFCSMFSFGKHMHQPNNKRCQKNSDSIKMRNQHITKTRFVTSYKKLNERKSITEFTNISKRNKKSLQLQSLSCSDFIESEYQQITLATILKFYQLLIWTMEASSNHLFPTSFLFKNRENRNIPKDIREVAVFLMWERVWSHKTIWCLYLNNPVPEISLPKWLTSQSQSKNNCQ